MSDLTDQIEADAAKPQSASIDGNSVSKRSLSELIEADAYMKANEAVASINRGFVLQRLQPPGSV